MSKATDLLNEMAQTHRVTGRATNIRKEGDYTSIRYHDTDVVKFNDKEIILDTGGWKTNTTRTRMNQAAHQYHLGYDVFQKKFKWYVGYKGETIPFEDNVLKLKR